MAGIYLHIPFCKQKCNYCNFHFSTSANGKDALLQAMQREIELQKNYLSNDKVSTIYFGGGTPSLLTADEINQLTEAIFQNFETDPQLEFTLEANPDDLTNTVLKSLKATPINRFSIGVQSFRDTDLKFMNRAHNAQEAEYAIKASQDAGFTNLSIDLIYGTPGLSNQHWLSNLNQLTELEVPHFSAYALTVEQGTALHHAIEKKKTLPLDAEQAAAQFEILMEHAAKNGFEHYEISNFAKPDCYAVHNTNYWRGVPYLGVGPSAHSFNGTSRQWNVANNALYTHNLLAEKMIPFEIETLTSIQQLNEYLMTSLRTMWGCDTTIIEEKWGSDSVITLLNKCAVFFEKNWMENENNKLLLTRKGKLFADRIAADLFFLSSAFLIAFLL